MGKPEESKVRMEMWLRKLLPSACQKDLDWMIG